MKYPEDKRDRHIHPLMIFGILFAVIMVIVLSYKSNHKSAVEIVQNGIYTPIPSGYQEVCTKTINVEKLEVIGNLDDFCCIEYCYNLDEQNRAIIRQQRCGYECSLDDPHLCIRCVETEYNRNRDVNACRNTCMSLHVENFPDEMRPELFKAGCVETKAYLFNETICTEKTLIKQVKEVVK